MIDRPMSWWMYPMKPVRIRESTLQSLRLGDYWLEPKLDGHRAILIVDGKKKNVWTRQKNPIKLPQNLLDQLAGLKLEDGTVLDGEIWNPLKRGGWESDGKEPCVLSFWDCVQRGTNNLSRRPIEERRRALVEIVGDRAKEIRVVSQEETTEQAVKKIMDEAKAFRKETQSRSGFVHGAVLKLKKSERKDHATRSVERSDWLKLVMD